MQETGLRMREVDFLSFLLRRVFKRCYANSHKRRETLTATHKIFRFFLWLVSKYRDKTLRVVIFLMSAPCKARNIVQILPASYTLATKSKQCQFDILLRRAGTRFKVQLKQTHKGRKRMIIDFVTSSLFTDNQT